MTTAIAPKETHESQTLYVQAMEKLNRNRARDAMTDLEEALQISPRNAEYLSHYGLCVALENEDYASALKLCRRAVEMDAKNPVNQVNLGKVYRMRGENAIAHETFLKAWRVDTRHPLPAGELSRMGIRRPPVLSFLHRSHWLNVSLGKVWLGIERATSRR